MDRDVVLTRVLYLDLLPVRERDVLRHEARLFTELVHGFVVDLDGGVDTEGTVELFRRADGLQVRLRGKYIIVILCRIE